MNREELVRRGNIILTQWNGDENVGCYLGNGRFGGIFSGLGLNRNLEQQKDTRYCPSNCQHMSHWGRFQFYSRHIEKDSSADYILPLYSLYWESEVGCVTEYRQCHDLYDGVLYTEFTEDSSTSIRVTAWFDGVHRDLAGIVIDMDSSKELTKKIRLSVPTLVEPSWIIGKSYSQFVSAEQNGAEWRMAVACKGTANDNNTALYINADMSAEYVDAGLTFTLKPGKNRLLISVNTPISHENIEESLKRTKEYWHRTWQEIGIIEYSDDQIQKVLLRGMAYLLSSYDADCKMIQPASSMGIGFFKYNFVPDIGNIAPALLMLGRQDIVKHWVEIFAQEIDGLYTYAKHLWSDAKGIFPPWELNHGSIEGYHYPSVPLIYDYEAHNSGYLCKLAMEAAEFVNDEVWGETYAYPLIRGCAEFFRAFCHKEEDGFWHLRWFPCMGRDEYGGVNREDYLCTLITAKYSFQSAIKCGLDAGCDYQQILSDGLAFESLLSAQGIWHTCRGVDDDLGKQKHPIQLEGIACFPMESAPCSAEIEAYKLRHDITAEIKIPKFHGWTLAQLLIADTNMKNYQEWSYDWSLIIPSNNMDENLIQFYESSGSVHSPFYTATHGMVMQSLIRNCINDYWGYLEIGSCLPENATVRFWNIRTRLGVSLTGKIENRRFKGTITALRDCQIVLGKETLIMKKGESMILDQFVE